MIPDLVILGIKTVNGVPHSNLKQSNYTIMTLGFMGATNVPKQRSIARSGLLRLRLLRFRSIGNRRVARLRPMEFRIAT